MPVIADTWKYYQQASEELSRCREEKMLFSFADEHALDFYGSLLAKSPLSGTYVTPLLRFLRRYDSLHRTSYYQTARAYILSQFHPLEAARMLGIHRNSLNYRLDRIRELTDFSEIDSLSTDPDPERIKELLLSCVLLDYTNMHKS